MIESLELNKHISFLFDKAGLSSKIISMESCLSGGNNRTYKVETPDGVFAVKKYFRQNGDIRDRLASEYAFISYAMKAAPGMVPIPYSHDKETGMALYEFVEGEPLSADDITKKDITQAAKFFCDLNSVAAKVNATKLPFASEACFSIQEHLDLIGARIQSLQQIDSSIPEDEQAEEFIEQLNTYWQTLVGDVKDAAKADGIDLTASLSEAQRCISPSDFGFHNALRAPDGNIRFLDFEYAGWDDPAKMTGDFFSQLAIPIPPAYFDPFVRIAMTPFPDYKQLIKRAQLLRPVYQVKWCCIALNIFIPVNLARRRFANPYINEVDLKQSQLKKAETLLENLEDLNYG